MNQFLERALNERSKAEGTGFSITAREIQKRAKNINKVNDAISKIVKLNSQFDKDKSMDFNNSIAKKIERLMEKVKI
jgi:hypothetical protein